jgi:hypothetical protein
MTRPARLLSRLRLRHVAAHAGYIWCCRWCAWLWRALVRYENDTKGLTCTGAPHTR